MHSVDATARCNVRCQHVGTLSQGSTFSFTIPASTESAWAFKILRVGRRGSVWRGPVPLPQSYHQLRPQLLAASPMTMIWYKITSRTVESPSNAARPRHTYESIALAASYEAEERPTRLETHEEVDVAISALLAPCHRSENPYLGRPARRRGGDDSLAKVRQTVLRRIRSSYDRWRLDRRVQSNFELHAAQSPRCHIPPCCTAPGCSTRRLSLGRALPTRIIELSRNQAFAP